MIRILCEGFFLGTPTLKDIFKAHAEQGIMDLLDHVCNEQDMILDNLQHRIGQELHEHSRYIHGITRGYNSSSRTARLL